MLVYHWMIFFFGEFSIFFFFYFLLWIFFCKFFRSYFLTPNKSSFIYVFFYISQLNFIFSGVLCFEVVWLVIGVIWITQYYRDCPLSVAKDALVGQFCPLLFSELLFFYDSHLWRPFPVVSKRSGSDLII